MQPYKHNTVLLIDDSYIDNLINRKILENNNFAENIVVIDSPHQAVNYLKECFETNQNVPEILFLDLRMPEMSGFDFLKALHTIPGVENGKLKIFVLSSSLDPHDLKQIEENSLVTRFIGKPLTKEILQDI